MATTCVSDNDAALELEAMCKEDSSWHPCEVSLSSNGAGLMVHFGSQNKEDIVLNKEEVLVRVRIRSVPLEGDDCSCIEEGEQVLASDKSQLKSLFYDAKIEKVLRVRHSKRVYCRCTFVINWLHQDLKGETFNVPSSSICKLSPKAINIHPTIAAFLTSVKSLSFSGASPFPTLLEDLDCELDLNKLVEQQIEEIGNLAADPPNKTKSEHTQLEAKDDFNMQIPCKPVSASNVCISLHEVPHTQNRLRRSTRSSCKLQVQMEVEDLPPSALSIPEKLPEIKSHLSPLAGRAALASLVSKIAQKLDFSSNQEEGMKWTSIQTNKLMKDTHSSDLEVASVSVVSDSIKVVKPLISNDVEPSSGIVTEENNNDSATSEIANSNASLKGLVTKKKLNRPTNSTRITRSSVQKSTQKGSNTESDSSEGNIDVPSSNGSEKESTVLKMKKSVLSPFGAESKFPIKGSNKRQMSYAVDNTRQTEGNVSTNGTSSQGQKRKSTSSEMQVLRSSPRLRFLPRT